MNEIKEALWHDYKEVSDLIESLDANSEEYKVASEDRDKIRNELIKLEQIELENEHEKIRNGITIGTFLVTTGVSIYALAKTFKFDQVATVTSTLGRNILNSFIPKMFKR